MSTFVELLSVAIVFWGFIIAYLIFLTVRMQKMEKELSGLHKKVEKKD